MPEDLLYVVGNNLSSSATVDDMVSVSELAEMLAEGRLDGRACVVVLGQGVGRRELDYLRHVAAVHGASGIKFEGEPAAEPAGRAVTHKARAENVLITGIRQTAEGAFAARLCVSDTNEMVLDHGSKDHLSGMVLMEAARQMSMAVAETYFIPTGRERWRFVINDWRTSFRRFLVPLDAEIVARLEAPETGRSGALNFSIRCEVVQAKRISAVHEIQFSAFPVAALQAIQDKQTADVLRTLGQRVAV